MTTKEWWEAFLAGLSGSPSPSEGSPVAQHRDDDPPVLGTDEFEHPDGTVYVRVDPNQFPLWDERDSRLVEG